MKDMKPTKQGKVFLLLTIDNSFHFNTNDGRVLHLNLLLVVPQLAKELGLGVKMFFSLPPPQYSLHLTWNTELTDASRKRWPGYLSTLSPSLTTKITSGGILLSRLSMLHQSWWQNDIVGITTGEYIAKNANLWPQA